MRSKKLPLKATRGVRGRPRKTFNAPAAVFGSYLILHPNTLDAIQRVELQAYRQFDGDTGGIVEKLRIEEARVNADLRLSDECLADLCNRLGKTKEFERAAFGDNSTPFRDWSLRDRLFCVIAVVLSVVVVGMGAANVYANLMSAGLPVFIESPLLCWLLSAIVPSSAFVLHCAYHFLQNEQSRLAFDRLLLGCTALMVAAWSWLFASEFAGVTAALSLDSYSNDHSGSLFVWVQIGSETLLGASLARIADQICAIYESAQYRRTHEFLELEGARLREKALNDELRDESAALAGRRCEVEASREAAASLAVAEFVARRVRFDSYSN